MVLGPRWLIPLGWCQEPGQGSSRCKDLKELVPSPNRLAFVAQKASDASAGRLSQPLVPTPSSGGGCRYGGSVKGTTTEFPEEGSHCPRTRGTWLTAEVTTTKRAYE